MCSPSHTSSAALGGTQGQCRGNVRGSVKNMRGNVGGDVEFVRGDCRGDVRIGNPTPEKLLQHNRKH